MRIHQIDEKYGTGHIENLAHEIKQKSEQLSDECLDNSFVVTEGQPRNIVHVKECDFKLSNYTNTRPIPDPQINEEIRCCRSVEIKKERKEIKCNMQSACFSRPWNHSSISSQ